MIRIIRRHLALLVAAALAPVALLHADPAPYDWQGQLLDAQTPVTEAIDLEFRLFNASAEGDQLGATLSFPATSPDAAGRLALELDFTTDAWVASGPKWLEVSVQRPAGTGGFVALPRTRVGVAAGALADLADPDAASTLVTPTAGDTALLGSEFGTSLFRPAGPTVPATFVLSPLATSLAFGPADVSQSFIAPRSGPLTGIDFRCGWFIFPGTIDPAELGWAVEVREGDIGEGGPLLGSASWTNPTSLPGNGVLIWNVSFSGINLIAGGRYHLVLTRIGVTGFLSFNVNDVYPDGQPAPPMDPTQDIAFALHMTTRDGLPLAISEQGVVIGFDSAFGEAAISVNLANGYSFEGGTVSLLAHALPGAGADPTASFSRTTDGRALDASSSGRRGIAIDAETHAPQGAGVRASGPVAGVSGTGPVTGVHGVAHEPGAYGVHGRADIPSQYGVFASGNIGATGFKTFRIDHPDDPANFYLQHYNAEGDAPRNVYYGTITLDETGAAWVDLPEYFELINRDPQYQLTALGAPAPLYAAAPVRHNRFRIAGGDAGQRVCWEVTAIRHDPWVRRHGAPVEVTRTTTISGAGR